MNLSALELIQFIHRETEDSRVNFCAKPRGRFRELASIEMGEMELSLPSLMPHLKHDAYFSPNSFWRPSKSINRKTGIEGPFQGKENLQWLNGLFLDIDTGREQLPPDDPKSQATPEGMCMALENIERENFPHPTLWALSGQGFYLFWAFSQPIRAWPEDIDRLEKAQRALGFVHPAVDRATTNANRILRIPGTRHSVTGSITTWETDVLGVTRYPHDELWARLGVEAKRATQYVVTQKVGTAPNRLSGMHALFKNIKREIEALDQHRGGFCEGMRRYALTLYAVAQLKQGETLLAVGEAVERLADQCRPVFPSHKNDPSVCQIVRDAIKVKNEHRTARAIIRRLQITQVEADLLGLHTLNPAKDENRAEARASRAENLGIPKRTTRHQFVETFVETNPDATMRQILEAAGAAGIKASLGTIHSDLQEIARASSQSTDGEPS